MVTNDIFVGFPRFTQLLRTKAKQKNIGVKRLYGAISDRYNKLSLDNIEYDIPLGTLQDWWRGKVKKPGSWRRFLIIARSLEMNLTETSEFLKSASFEPVVFYIKTSSVNRNDKLILDFWNEEVDGIRNKQIFQADPVIPYFTNRFKELKELTEIILARNYKVFIIEGRPGIGKTVLVNKLAEDLSDNFPEGILVADMASDHLDLMNLLFIFADTFHIDVRHITDLPGRSRIVKGILANKEIMIIFDSVKKSEDLTYLLPNLVNGIALVTTNIPELSNQIDGYPYTLSVFDDPNQSLELIRKILELKFNQTPDKGKELYKHWEAVLEKIAIKVGHLPKALEFVAHNLPNPDFSEDLVLRKLHENEEQESLDEVFDSGYKSLEPQTKLVFDSIGLFEMHEFSLEALAYINEISEEEALRYLDALYRYHLIESSNRLGKYKIHSLLKNFAINNHLQKPETVYKFVEYYLVPFLQKNRKNYDLISLELDNISAAFDIALDDNLDKLFIDGVISITRFLFYRGILEKLEKYTNLALTKARSLKTKKYKLSELLDVYSGILVNQREFNKADPLITEGYSNAKAYDNEKMICQFLFLRGTWFAMQEDYDQAEAFYNEALPIAKKSISTETECNILKNLSGIKIYQDNIVAGQDLALQALEIAKREEYEETESTIITNIISIYDRLHDLNNAWKYSVRQIDLAEHTGNYYKIAHACAIACSIFTNLGQYDFAEKYIQRSLELNDIINDPEVGYLSYRNKGLLLAHQENFEKMDEFFQKALEIALSEDNEYWRQTLLLDWGKALSLKKDFQEARITFSTIIDTINQIKENNNYQRNLAEAHFGRSQVFFNLFDHESACDDAFISEKIYKDLEYDEDLRLVQEWIKQIECNS